MEMLKVNDLAVYFGQEPRLVKAIDHISFSLNRGEILGIVGESGSGKTKTAETIMGILPPTARIISGEISFEGEDLLSLPESRMKKIRGEKITLIPQDPTGSLNPVICVGEQIKEMYAYHRKDIKKQDRRKSVADLLGQVRIPDAQKRYTSFPHELSGGMNQRAIISMTLAVSPTAQLIIADEPTTALDVTVQAKVLDDLTDLVREMGISLILITHNLGLIAEYADRVLVMKKGEIIEEGLVDQIFYQPQNPYTKHLLDVVPRLGAKKTRGRIFQAKKTILDIQGLKVYFPIPGGKFIQKRVGDIKAVDDVNLRIGEGETLGLVGESGCGKTTLARAILGLNEITSGKIFFEGDDLGQLSEEQEKIFKRKIQVVFQDPYLTLNPRMKVRDAVAEGIDVHKLAKDKEEREEKLIQIMNTVELENPEDMMGRFPIEFSAGQRQRISIARALAVDPTFLICDEPVSALDVSVQDEILELLSSLKEKFGLTTLFITHDLAVVEQISDKIAVMYLGKIVEYAGNDEFFENPLHPYTELLLSSVPIADPKRVRGRKKEREKRDIREEILISAEHMPSGCRFHPRCPLADTRCSEEEPDLRDVGKGHFVACHKV